MALQHLRSNTANKRPTAGAMSDGQIAVNTNATSPGLFFKDAGGTITKVGPVHVGTTAPNSSPAAGGSTGNSVGEQWLDTSGGGYVLKIWDGSAWRSEVGEFVDAAGDTMTGALILPSGTAAAPALGVGSTDNGIYSPGTDQVAISTSGTEQVRVDGSGRVLIGTTTEGQADADNFTVADSGNCGITIRSGTANNGAISFSDGISGTDEYRGYILYEQNTDVMRFGLNTLERIRFTGEGRIGIGTSSPNATLDIRRPGGGNLASFIGTSANSYIAVSDNNYANNVNFGAINSGDCYIFSQSGKSTLIYSGGSERMRIDSSGRLLVGTGSDSGGALLQVNGDRIRVATAKTPASASDTGTAGEICWDADYIYVCTATNTWKRAALSTW